MSARSRLRNIYSFTESFVFVFGVLLAMSVVFDIGSDAFQFLWASIVVIACGFGGLITLIRMGIDRRGPEAEK